MASTKRKPTAADPATDYPAAFARMQAAAPEDILAFYTALLEGVGEIGAEVAQFVSERIAEDLRTQQEVLSCTNPAELVHIQMRFLQRAFEQYSAETGKIVNLGNHALNEALTRHLHKRAKDNAPL